MTALLLMIPVHSFTLFISALLLFWLEPMFGKMILLKSPELRAFSKSFEKTTVGWMKSGRETFNRKVMNDGIPAACAFARSARDRAAFIFAALARRLHLPGEARP